MSTNLSRRLEQLERAHPESWPRAHRLIGDTTEELDARRDALIAIGEAAEDDLFIYRRIISPDPGRMG